MNNQLSKLKSVKREEGFTIIEVLIVLAIGTLIILAVLLAVPALQRNQQNSQRKTEASRVSSAAVQYIADGNTITTQANVNAIKANAQLGTNPRLTTFTYANTVAATNTALTAAANATNITAVIATSMTCTNPTAYAAGNATQAALVYRDANQATVCLNIQ